MKAVSFAVALCVACVVRPVGAVCPVDAVFLALGPEVRGFSLRANGTVSPCQVLVEASNVAWGLIAIGPDASLRLSGFQNSTLSGDGPVNIFPAFASGNASPLRTAYTFTTDHISLTTDRWGNDYVLARETVIFLPNGTNGEPSPLIGIPAAGVASIASDGDGNLLMAAWDDHGGVFIKTMGTSLSKSAPPLLRTLGGSATGFFPSGFSLLGQTNLEIAVNPVGQELYVYNASEDHSQSQVLVFAAGADGNVAPLRKLAGPTTGIGIPQGGLDTNKIAVSSDGRLFVSEPLRRILVFAPGVSGDVAPSQVIQDGSPGSSFLNPEGGVAVRSCNCKLPRWQPRHGARL